MARFCGVVLAAALALASATPAFGEKDQVSFAQNIDVPDGTSAGDVVCLFCSVHIRGQVRGDVVAVLGSVAVDDGRSISGDLVAINGDVSLANNASVRHDVAVVGGGLEMAPDASVGGERSVMQGRGWLLVPFAPLLIFVGVVWLIVWLVQRNRYTFPMYPQGRGL